MQKPYGARKFLAKQGITAAVLHSLALAGQTVMVEAGGIEPPSADDPQAVLHA
jgi:hypothetical protein